MDRKPTEIEIEGTTFQFDIDKIALIEKNNPNNEIYFTYMRDEETHYSFNYSAASKNYSFIRSAPTLDDLFDEIERQQESPEPAIPIKIPRIGVMDPEGMCRKYGCTLQDLEQKSDFEIMVNQDAYNRRLNGEPVTIDLAGKTYEIDVKNNSLRPQDGKGEEILLNDYYYDYYDEDEEVYHLFYNISEKRVSDILSDGTSRRTDDRVILEVPNLTLVDPIGRNMQYGYNVKMGLLYDNLKMHHKAKPVPWDVYGIKADGEKVIVQPKNIEKDIAENIVLFPPQKAPLKKNISQKRRGRKM